MDLRNNQITLGELWDNPRSRAVFQRKVPMLAKHPVKGCGPHGYTGTIGRLFGQLGPV